ncbi:MAG: helicase HerA domain-containing protein [[Clostridium] scindens]
MLSVDPDQGFCIGGYAAYECPAWINGNKFFQRHACIVGNTGSGKSETVAKILEEAGKLPGANLIVFDIHGEYSGLSYARNIKIGEEFHFPVWLLGFQDVAADILKVEGGIIHGSDVSPPKMLLPALPGWEGEPAGAV